MTAIARGAHAGGVLLSLSALASGAAEAGPCRFFCARGSCERAEENGAGEKSFHVGPPKIPFLLMPEGAVFSNLLCKKILCVFGRFLLEGESKKVYYGTYK